MGPQTNDKIGPHWMGRMGVTTARHGGMGHHGFNYCNSGYPRKKLFRKKAMESQMPSLAMG
jgi:hypothetical protein